MNPLQGLRQQGQSIWLDDIRRSLIWTGSLHRMVNAGGLSGLTSNPSTFESAIGASADYGPALAALVSEGLDPGDAYEQLAVEDLRWACDVLRPVYDDTAGRDGYCSLEVSPYVAGDATETVEEANRLWDLVGRANLMVRIPGTQAALTALPELVAQGINVNVALLFSVERYRAVQEAYMAGIEELVRAGGDPSAVASVASFFVSRIDTMVDAHIDDRLASADEGLRATLAPLRGRAGVAIGKLAYRAYREAIASERWRRLAAEGAHPQRLLWTSTSPKDPSFRDVCYVEGLVGADTVVAVPDAIYRAFGDHGEVAPTLTADVDASAQVVSDLAEVGIPYEAVAAVLLEEGVQAYVESYDRLMGTLQRARAAIIGDAQPNMHMRLGALQAAVERRTQALDEASFVRRLWGRDGSLFGDDGSADVAAFPMGWLDVVEAMGPYVEHLVQLQDKLEVDEVESVVLMAGGGAGRAAEAFARTFGQLDGSPELLVLDATTPEAIRAVEGEISAEETLFVVASKDGEATGLVAAETYFYEQGASPDQFIAITDPGSELEARAMRRDYLSVFHSDPEVGHRYSALSPFGMLPAAAMGLDVEELLDRAQLMVASCSEAVPAEVNPGVLLGAALGELARAGRDKLTLVTSSGLRGLGPWIEHLVTESTGKDETGILVVDGEPLGAATVYGDDRVFAYLALEDDEDDDNAAVLDRLDALYDAGHPVLMFELADPRDVVQEMFRWQVATATAAHVLGVNPFDQPDAERVERTVADRMHGVGGRGTDGTPAAPIDAILVAESEGLAVYADAATAGALGPSRTGAEVLTAHLGQVEPGDYVAFTAFIEPTEDHDAILQRLRVTVRDRHRVATTLAYGPRHFHGSAQHHLGGPNRGVFVQLTAVGAESAGAPSPFVHLKAAQAAADFALGSARGRRALQVQLGADVAQGLETLSRWITNR